MKFFNFNKTVQEPIKTNINRNFSNPKVIKLSSVETFLPTIKEKNGQDWIAYGIDNNYPKYLTDLFLSSPTHGAICKRKTNMIVGNGFTYDETSLTDENELVIKNLLSKLNTDISNIVLDTHIYGAFCLEIIYSLDRKNIIRINRINPEKIRSGKIENGIVENYYYSNDWNNRREDIKTIPSFELSDNESFKQLLYFPLQMTSNEFYADPSYSGGLNWINLESETGTFYRSLIENGFNPSVAFKFPYLPASAEEQEEIVEGLKDQYSGAKNAGKSIVLFGNGPENEVKVETVQSGGTDKMFTVISDQITTKVLTSHEVTTPELFGISEPGKLGSSDFTPKLIAFNEFVIKPTQRQIENGINQIFYSMNTDIRFKFNDFDISIFQNNTRNDG